MKIATWNINSVRLRLETVLAFLQQADIDVLCLQETKTQDLHFPAEAFAAAGWPHQAIRGEKSYNGVAIIARQPLAKIDHMEWTGKSDCRHIWAMTNDGIGIHNFYVPAGGDVPDIETNPKFAHKLQFIDEMTSHFSANQPKAEILVGDLNIAPLASDVWSSKQLLKIISHTPVETDGLKRLIADGGCMMLFVPILAMIRNYILGGLTGRAIGRPVIAAAVWIISGLAMTLSIR